VQGAISRRAERRPPAKAEPHLDLWVTCLCGVVIELISFPCAPCRARFLLAETLEVPPERSDPSPRSEVSLHLSSEVHRLPLAKPISPGKNSGMERRE
jgi:hypothetical protein